MQKVIKINAFQKGRLVSIVKKIIMLHQLELELTLTPKDALGTTRQIKGEIKDLKSSLKKTIALGGVGFDKWLVGYGLNIDNFDINVKEGR
jgi:hypothetical protein|tara:strand:- start:89 stop:361 length:273 start_codon:yes stop_codon:yes gene_type:complete